MLYCEFLINSYVAFCNAHDNLYKKEDKLDLYNSIKQTIIDNVTISTMTKIDYLNTLKDIKNKSM